jgi:hypothetical protein
VAGDTSNAVSVVIWSTAASADRIRPGCRAATDPTRDLDLASYGVVAVLQHERGTTYPDMAWGPKLVFGALAAAYARAQK